jgi:hypothetical protein
MEQREGLKEFIEFRITEPEFAEYCRDSQNNTLKYNSSRIAEFELQNYN